MNICESDFIKIYMINLNQFLVKVNDNSDSNYPKSDYHNVIINPRWGSFSAEDYMKASMLAYEDAEEKEETPDPEETQEALPPSSDGFEESPEFE